MRPEFSHITHYISELGERGSSTEFLMRYGAFGFTGLLYVCFAAALLATFQDGWYSTLAAGLIGLDGLGRIGAGGIRLRSWMRGALLEPGTAPPVRYSRLLIRYLGCNRVGLHFPPAWLAAAFYLVLRRYRHSGADFPSYNVVESQSRECSWPV